MMNIPDKITAPLSKHTVLSLNARREGPVSRSAVMGLNSKRREDDPAEVTGLPDMKLPPFVNPLKKGQKTVLDAKNIGINAVKVCFGWNAGDGRCDIDASAFLLNGYGRVPDDRWFVFYGQDQSPDRSVSFSSDSSGRDREMIHINFRKLDSSIQRIVFVLTINEAFENHLNFSMMKDAYIRILNSDTDQELFSYRLDEYSENVISMTLGEIYFYNGQWKFNPVGNGVCCDLAGQCAAYGVEVG